MADKPTVANLSEQLVALREELSIDRSNYQEAIRELEFELEEIGWDRISGSGANQREFTSTTAWACTGIGLPITSR